MSNVCQNCNILNYSKLVKIDGLYAMEDEELTEGYKYYSLAESRRRK